MEGVLRGMEEAMIDAALDKMRTGEYEADVLQDPSPDPSPSPDPRP